MIFWREFVSFKIVISSTKIKQKINYRVEICGEINFLKSMSVAQLCLKHRINKHQKQRIVVFVSSLVNATEEELEKLAQKLKRNSIAVNLVNLCEDSNKAKLQKVTNCIRNNQSLLKMSIQRIIVHL